MIIRYSFFFFLRILPPPRSTLFPYTTLFRSRIDHFVDVTMAAFYEVAGRAADHGVPESCDRRHVLDRKSTRLNSSHQIISYAVFCLKKKNKKEKAVSVIKYDKNQKCKVKVEY